MRVMPIGTTTLSGRILASKDAQPIKNVTIKLGELTAMTDGAGYFIIKNPPIGNQVLIIDGHTANTSGSTYPSSIPVAVTVSEGDANGLPYTIHLHEANTKTYTDITQNQTRDIEVTDPDIPDFKMIIPQGAQIIGHDGQPNEKVSITTLPLDQIPIIPIPDGIYTKTLYMFYFFKPGGGTPTEPIPIIYPNDIGALPGERADLWYYDESISVDPNSNQWKIYGQGTVSEDGSQVIPDPGVGMPKFCCGATFLSTSGSNGGLSPGGGLNGSGESNSNCNLVNDPVDVVTGMYTFNSMDIDIPSTIKVVRNYRSTNTSTGPFGRGTTINFNHSLETINENSLMYTHPFGWRYIFSKQPDGTYVTPSMLGAYATINPDNTRELSFKDGKSYLFGANGRLVELIDRLGKHVVIERTPFGGAIGNITAIRDNYGRRLIFTRELFSLGRNLYAMLITSIEDPTGRKVKYTYDSVGRLTTFTDPEGGVTTYTYDSANRLISITKPKGNLQITNEYDSAARVIKQTRVDGGVYSYFYTIVGGTVTQADVTDPLGNNTTYRLNNSGYISEIINALGQKITYEREAGTNHLLSIADSLGRKTMYTYDENGNTKSVIDAAGNLTQYEYDSTFNNPVSVTDALGNTSFFEYDDKGNLITATDSLGNSVALAYNDYGQPTSVTGAMGNTTTFEYGDFGNLITVTDPLGNQIHREYDYLSRLLKATDAKGRSTKFVYDGLNRVVESINSIGAKTSFVYDLNRTLLSLTDAKGQMTSYSYDEGDRLVSITDPSGNTEQYEYDINDNLLKGTDRKGQVTLFEYNELNMVEKVTYGDGSTTGYIHDAAGRVSSINDSISGMIEYEYSDSGCAACGGAVDKVIKEITALGTVSYEYDALGRRTTMQIAGMMMQEG
jgi:YD repeat-containing protein